ncbi:MAG: hypothetical protein HY059_09735 [Proteobacteria bacterium]|nr:hypothetical protein [Pseudomonadota bacterium]
MKPTLLSLMAALVCLAGVPASAQNDPGPGVIVSLECKVRSGDVTFRPDEVLYTERSTPLGAGCREDVVQLWHSKNPYDNARVKVSSDHGVCRHLSNSDSDATVTIEKKDAEWRWPRVSTGQYTQELKGTMVLVVRRTGGKPVFPVGDRGEYTIGMQCVEKRCTVRTYYSNCGN